jgi:hypothetical protein
VYSHNEISGSHAGEYEDETVFWDVAPCILVEVTNIIALMMEAVSTYETLVNFY